MGRGSESWEVHWGLTGFSNFCVVAPRPPLQSHPCQKAMREGGVGDVSVGSVYSINQLVSIKPLHS